MKTSRHIARSPRQECDISTAVKSIFVTFPCGHRCCRSCYGKTDKCHIVTTRAKMRYTLAAARAIAMKMNNCSRPNSCESNSIALSTPANYALPISV